MSTILDHVATLEAELAAWRSRFPQYEYRPQDECVALKLKQEPVRYGCHCDLEPGHEPDGCVMDTPIISDCVHAQALAAEGKTQEGCKHWKPINPARKVT